MIKNRPQRPDVSGEEFSIVLLGDFNPKIYQPAWFASQGLLRESEAETAKVEIIHADLTSFSTDWFAIQVARNRFSLTVRSSIYKDHLRDFVCSTFHKLLHTPLSQMGLNYTARLHFKSDLDWHCFGHFLLPKSPWEAFLSNPGMGSLAVDGKRPDNLPGRIFVFAEAVRGTGNEVMLRVNDHCERPHDDKSVDAEFFLSVIEGNYDIIVNRSKKLVEGILDQYIKQNLFDDGKME